MKPKFAHHLLAAAAVATTLAFSSAPASAAVLVTDNVESHLNYTVTTAPSVGTGASAVWGLTAVAGSNWAFVTNNTSTAAISGTVRQTASFGPSFIVAAGTYTLSMYVGEGLHSPERRTFTTVVPVLTTIGGTEFVDKTVITPYVYPNTTSTAEWVLTEVQYVIPGGSPLIGQEFTWGFNWAKTSTDKRFAGVWDAATVDFVAIPEPSAALLGGLGMLVLLRRRR